MSIADYFANLGNPQARKEIVRSTFTGAVKSTVKGTTGKSKASAPFLKFAQERGQSATTLATEAGFAPPPAAPEAYVPGATPADVYRSTLLEVGYPQHVVDGMMMNVSDESGGNPAAIGDNGAAGGLVQWNGPRFAALQEFAAANGTDWHDPRVQALFTDHELKTSERGAYEAMMRTATPGEAGAAFLNLFERPAEVHRSRREAKYLGGEGNSAEFTNYDAGLSYGPELSEPNPLADEYIGRSADNYSMGMDSAAFDAAYAKDPRKAMEILNSQGLAEGASQRPYDDPILRFLQEGAEEASPTTALPNGGVDLGPSAAGLSMGVPVPADAQATAEGTGGGGGTGAAPAAATASTKSEEDAPKMTAVDRMMNAIYGTDVDDMDDDERADRRRAVGQAMTQGFQMLSRGTPMDIQPIIAQRMELQQVRRAAADLKNNAQGVSDMLIAAGMDELAQLPFMGENGMNAAMNTLASVATSSPADQPFDVDPAMRATMAQTLSDMGYEGPAQLVMNTPAGDGFKEVWNNAVGVSTRAPSEEGGNVQMTPDKVAAAATIARSSGNEVLASAIENGLISGGDLSKFFLEAGKVPLAADQAGRVAAATAGVDEQVEQRSAEQIAAGYEAAGLTEEAAIARAANSGPEAAQAITDYRASKALAAEEDLRQKNNAAMAAAVPADAENAEEMKALAATAVTDGDRQRVYEMFKKDEKTITQRDFEYAEKEPGYLGFIFDLKRAESGQHTYSFDEQLNMNTITAFSNQMAENRGARIEMQASVDTIRGLVVNPEYTMGPLQGTVLNTYQEWANSILGERAPVFREEDNLTADAVIEQVQNKLFAAATADLKGAVSDKETGYARATLVATTDLKLQALAKLQMMERLPEIQAAEYSAMLEWAKANPDNLGDADGMVSYINKKVGHMKVFDTVTPGERLDAWFDDPSRELGDVVSVMRPDGSSFLQAFIVE